MAQLQLKRTIPKRIRRTEPEPMGFDKKGEEDRHRKRMGWFFFEASRQAKNRAMMARCESYYDSEQIASKIAEEQRARGQQPTVYNEIKPSIDWMIGTELRARTDFLVIAEEGGPESDEDARLKTKLLKYLEATNKIGFERSQAAGYQLKGGMGWIEVGIRGDRSGPTVYVGADSWRNHLHDSQAVKKDLTDGRYHFRIKVVDLDVAIALFPDKEQQLRKVVQTGDNITAFNAWLGGSLIGSLDHFAGKWEPDEFNQTQPVDLFNPRERVMLIECWSREPVRRKLDDQGLGDPVSWEIHVAIMTEADTLLEQVSPFKHDRFPFVPVWAYRNSRTGLPYGPIFPLLGPQDAINIRMSRSVWEAAKNQLKVEKRAIDDSAMDLEEIRNELDDPRGIAVFADGALSAGAVQERDDLGKAQKQLALAERDIMHLRQSSGVTGENRGLDTNVTSGKAVIAKADQGGMLTAELFDNQLFARQLEGEMVLSLAEQFMITPRTIRVPGERWEYVRINEPQADGSYRNDISQRTAHFVVGEQAWKQAYAEAAFDQLMVVFTQLAAAAPTVVLAMLDVLFEIHPNLPKKQTLLQRIRSVTGQADPDGKLTPEQQRAKQQQQVRAQAQFEAEMAQLRATVKEAEAKGEKLSAESMAKRLETVYMAAQAAQVAVQIPGAMPVADQILKSAGFKDLDGGEVANVPEQGAVAPTAPQVPDPLQADGAMQGIETMAPDGVSQGV